MIEDDDQVHATLDAINGPQESLFDYSRKSRKMLKWVIASLVIDLILTTGLGLSQREVRHLAHQAKATAQKAYTLDQASVQACEVQNKYKADDFALWTKILSFSPPAGETVEEKARRINQTQEFQTFLVQHDAPRDCLSR